MAKSRGDFTDILVRRQTLSPDQVEEARSMQAQTGAKLQDAIVKLGYASGEEVMSAIAEFHGLQFVDLSEVTIPSAVIELVPESVARENVVLPMSQDNGALKIIMSDPGDFDTVQKLQFILNKDIQPVLAPREQIVEAINRHYGQTETESVDSMLQEFTDTAIDFTETTGAAAAAADESDARPAACWPRWSPVSKSWRRSTYRKSGAPRTGVSKWSWPASTTTSASASCRLTTASRS